MILKCLCVFFFYWLSIYVHIHSPENCFLHIDCSVEYLPILSCIHSHISTHARQIELTKISLLVAILNGAMMSHFFPSCYITIASTSFSWISVPFEFVVGRTSVSLLHSSGKPAMSVALFEEYFTQKCSLMAFRAKTTLN